MENLFYRFMEMPAITAVFLSIIVAVALMFIFSMIRAFITTLTENRKHEDSSTIPIKIILILWVCSIVIFAIYNIRYGKDRFSTEIENIEPDIILEPLDSINTYVDYIFDGSKHANKYLVVKYNGIKKYINTDDIYLTFRDIDSIDNNDSPMISIRKTNYKYYDNIVVIFK